MLDLETRHTAAAMGLEYEDLQTPDPEGDIRQRLEADSNNAWLSHKLAILSIVLSVFSFVMTVSLYNHHPGRTFFWHCFWLFVTFLMSIYALLWASRARRAIDFGRDPVPLQSAVVFISTAILVVVHVTGALWFFLFKPLHFAYLQGVASYQEEWNHRFEPNDFHTMWRADRKRMSWVIFCSVIMALCLLFIAYSARTIHSQKYNLSRVMVYVLLCLSVFAAWMMIYWSKETILYTEVMPRKIGGWTPSGLKVAAVLALLLAVGNGLANLHKRKPAYLIFGILLIAHLTVTVCMAGKLMRETREACFVETFSTTDCVTTMVSIHEDNLSRFCPVGEKYLPNGVTCRKKDLVSRWENKSNPNELRYANPGCCSVAKFFYVRPSMEMAQWSLILVVLFGLIAAMNIFLSRFDEGIFGMSRIVRGTDCFSILATVCILITFGLYYLAMPESTIRYGSNPQVMSYLDPEAYPIRGLDLVPSKIKERGAQDLAEGNCFRWHEDVYPVPTFDSADSSCSMNCIHRIAIFVVNGKMIPSMEEKTFSSDGDGGASRPIFFPGCTTSHGNYYYFYGKLEDVQRSLGNSRLCGDVPSMPMTIYVSHDQQPAGTLNSRGLLNTEEAKISGLVSGSNQSVMAGVCMGGFTESTECRGACKVSFNTAKVGYLGVMKGKFYYVKDGQIMRDIHPGIIIEPYNGKTRVGSGVNIYEGGLFSIEGIMRLYEYNYVLTLNIIDPTEVFESKKVDVWVKDLSDVKINTELSAGYIRLTTKDGLVCNVNDRFCIQSQQQKKGKLLLTVVLQASSNPMENSMLAGDTRVLLYRGYQIEGAIVDTMKVTDPKGQVSIKDLNYDSYTVKIIKQGYIPEIRFVDLQEEKLIIEPIIMQPAMGTHDMKVEASIHEPQVDFDLFLEIHSDKGFQCTVSPYNKYCGYSIDSNDVVSGIGEESIFIKRLAVAEYLAYLAPADPYTGSCKYAFELQGRDTHFESTPAVPAALPKGAWDWSNFKATRPLSSLHISTFTVVKGADTKYDLHGRMVNVLPENPPVEGRKRSKMDKKLLSINGTILKEPIMMDTNFLDRTDIYGRITANPNAAVPQLGKPKTFLTPTVTDGRSPLKNTTAPLDLPRPEPTEEPILRPENIPEKTNPPKEPSTTPNETTIISTPFGPVTTDKNQSWLPEDPKGSPEVSTKVNEDSGVDLREEPSQAEREAMDRLRRNKTNTEPTDIPFHEVIGRSEAISSTAPEEKVYDVEFDGGVSHISVSTRMTKFKNDSQEFDKDFLNLTQLKNGTLIVTNSTLVNVTDDKKAIWQLHNSQKIIKHENEIKHIFNHNFTELKTEQGVDITKDSRVITNIFEVFNETKNTSIETIKDGGQEVGIDSFECDEILFTNGTSPRRACSSLVETYPIEKNQISESKFNTLLENVDSVTGNQINRQGDKTITDYRNGSTLVVVSDRWIIAKPDGRNTTRLTTESIFGVTDKNGMVKSNFTEKVTDHRNGSREVAQKSVYNNSNPQGISQQANESKVELYLPRGSGNKSWVHRDEYSFDTDRKFVRSYKYNKIKDLNQTGGSINVAIQRSISRADGDDVYTRRDEHTNIAVDEKSGYSTSFNRTWEVNFTHFGNHPEHLVSTVNNQTKNTTLVRDLSNSMLKFKKINIHADLRGMFKNESTVNQEYSYVNWANRNRNNSWNNITETKTLYYVCHASLPCNSTRRHFEQREEGDSIRNSVEVTKSDMEDSEGKYSIYSNKKNFMYGNDYNSSIVSKEKTNLFSGFTQFKEYNYGFQRFKNSVKNEQSDTSKTRTVTEGGPHAAVLKRSEIIHEINNTIIEAPSPANKSASYFMSTTENLDGSLTNNSKYFEMLTVEPSSKQANSSFTYTMEYSLGPRSKDSKGAPEHSATSLKVTEYNETADKPYYRRLEEEKQVSSTRDLADLLRTVIYYQNTTFYRNGTTIITKEEVASDLTVSTDLQMNHVNFSRIVIQGDNTQNPSSTLEYNLTVVRVENGVRTIVKKEIHGPTSRRLLLTGANLQGETEADPNDTGNYVWISCFTGYGYPSILEFNRITVNKPLMSDCSQMMKEQRPNHTLEKLRAETELINSNAHK